MDCRQTRPCQRLARSPVNMSGNNNSVTPSIHQQSDSMRAAGTGRGAAIADEPRMARMLNRFEPMTLPMAMSLRPRTLPARCQPCAGSICGACTKLTQFLWCFDADPAPLATATELSLRSDYRPPTKALTDYIRRTHRRPITDRVGHDLSPEVPNHFPTTSTTPPLRTHYAPTILPLHTRSSATTYRPLFGVATRDVSKKQARYFPGVSRDAPGGSVVDGLAGLASIRSAPAGFWMGLTPVRNQ